MHAEHRLGGPARVAAYKVCWVGGCFSSDILAAMEKAIDEALSADFEQTLLWAVELREKYLMRLNPQVILVRAALHPGREAYTRTHPGAFAKIAQRVMARGDDVTNQVQYYLAKNGSKRGIPAILKRSWAQRVSSMDAYSMAKYGRAGIGLVPSASAMRRMESLSPGANTPATRACRSRRYACSSRGRSAKGSASGVIVIVMPVFL